MPFCFTLFLYYLLSHVTKEIKDLLNSSLIFLTIFCFSQIVNPSLYFIDSLNFLYENPAPPVTFAPLWLKYFSSKAQNSRQTVRTVNCER
jgi:hypothetical protein